MVSPLWYVCILVYLMHDMNIQLVAIQALAMQCPIVRDTKEMKL